MGALDYAMAGAVKGGADTWLQISGEDRQENRDIRKEGRDNKFQELRDRRLAEINKEEKALDRTARKENLQAGFDQRTSDNDSSIASRETIAANELEFEQSKPITETTARGAVTKQYNKKTGAWDVVSDQPYDDGSLGGWDIDAVDKEFDSKADTYFGSLDKSGVLTAFDSDEKASMAARAASISSTTWRKYGGRINPNTIWTKVFETIKGGKIKLDKDLSELDAAIEEIPESAWYRFDETNRANEAQKGKLEDEKETITDQERSNIDSVDMTPGGSGMLDQSTDEKPPMKVNSVKEAMSLPPGTKIELPDGTIGTVPRRQ